MAAIRLTQKWYLCRDTSCPIHYPPRARDEMVYLRLALDDCRRSRYEWRDSDSHAEDVWHHRYDGQAEHAD